MLKLEYIYEKNIKNRNIKNRKKKRNFVSKKNWILKYGDSMFTGGTLKKILEDMEDIFICNKYRLPISIEFNSESFRISDKLSFVVLECLCYHLIEKYPVCLRWTPKLDISTEGIKSSPLIELNKLNPSKEKFKEKFEFHLDKTHFRKIVKADNERYLSNLDTTINLFLKNSNIEEEYGKTITEVVVELVGNACEHTGEECLLDIDITEEYLKKGEEGDFYGINIVVLNISDCLLGDGLRKKFNASKEENLPERYREALSAYSNHEKKFDSKYDAEDFFNVLAFQDKISGRENTYDSNSGGTGLKILINSLQDSADTDECYVLSGRRVLRFIRKYLEYDSEDWIAFDIMGKSFLRDAPNSKVIERCPVNLPGTAYNLHFVMKRKDK